MSASCDNLSAFIDGELPAPAMDDFRDHLAACPRCADGLGECWLIESRLLALQRRQRIEARLVGLALAFLLAAGLVAVVLAGGLR